MKNKKTVSIVIMAVMIFQLLIGGTFVYADPVAQAEDTNVPVAEADVSTPSDGCVFVGLPGTYYANDQDALNRINEIRREACMAGDVPDPRDADRMLTESDYVPIKWSSDLEQIARVRAYESAITNAHSRLNGKEIWSVTSYDVRSDVEVLAWNSSTGLLDGVNEWYGEKENWVSRNSEAETGHYTEMINPDNTYVGLGCFCSSETKYFNTTAGEFSSKTSELDSKMMEPIGSVIQKVEVHTSNISGFQLSADKSELTVGETASLTLDAVVQGADPITLSVLEGAVYQSSDDSIASVSEDGTVTGVKAGTAVITAKAGDQTATCEVTVTDPVIEVTSITLNKTSAEITTGNTETLTAEVEPADATDKTVTWSSSDSETASVSDGTVTGVKAGTATITAKAGEQAATCEVTVADPAPEKPEFIDVKSDDYFYDSVQWAVEKGITRGTSNTEFSPDNECTRAQAVTFLWRAEGSPAVQDVSNPFEDVEAGTYYYDAVLWAVANGITNGKTETTFGTEDTCTRGQIVTFLWRYKGSPAEAKNSGFSDVSSEAYYAAPVTWAVIKLITQGTSETEFSPDEPPCTRAHIVTFLFRAKDVKKTDNNSASNSTGTWKHASITCNHGEWNGSNSTEHGSADLNLYSNGNFIMGIELNGKVLDIGGTWTENESEVTLVSREKGTFPMTKENGQLVLKIYNGSDVILIHFSKA